MFTANIIGCGKVGKTIGKLIAQGNEGEILGIINSSMESAKNAEKYIGQGRAVEYIKELPKADLYFITTKDDLIKEIATELQATNTLRPGAIILHCSGSLSSDILNPLKKNNCLVASLHPIKSFANPSQAVSTFNGTYCSIEGDEQAILILTPIFQKLGAILFSIKKENKSIYHAGGVIANNYLITLHYQAMQCYIKAGADKETAMEIVSKLMNDAFENLHNSPHSEALTGPIQRGDINTIAKHINSLKQDSTLSQMKNIYLAMGHATIVLTNHDLSIKNKLTNILADEIF